MFAPLLPGVAADDVPITHVTNGVHAETWVGPEFAALYGTRLGDGYGARSDGWERLAEVSDAELFAARARRPAAARRRGAPAARRARRASAATRRASTRLGRRGARPAGAHARLRAARADLQAAHAAAARARAADAASCTSTERPVQLLVAGKAHPHDGDGKRLIEEFGAFATGARRAPPRDHARRLRHGARARARRGRRRLAQHAAAPARGLRHERHEGRAQRRAQPLDPRRLVGRVLRPGLRLGDPVGRGGRHRSRRRATRARRRRSST